MSKSWEVNKYTGLLVITSGTVSFALVHGRNHSPHESIISNNNRFNSFQRTKNPYISTKHDIYWVISTKHYKGW